MSVLTEILEWSATRPLWQRDALCRLVTKGSLDGEDAEQLRLLCLGQHGLAERRQPILLSREELKGHDGIEAAVSLRSVTHHWGVNALAEEQTLVFAPGLTVVYGGNATGKSGFARILKRACRARGVEEILGNVLGTAAPKRPSATIRFRVAGKDSETLWTDHTPDAALLRVSVFDTQSAAVYLKDKTDVAFRPFGLDLFEKLSAVCEDLRAAIEKEIRAVEDHQPPLPTIAAGTAAHALVSSLTSLTEPEEVKRLAALTEIDFARIAALRHQLVDLRSADLARTSRGLGVRASRAAALLGKLSAVVGLLSDASLSAAREARRTSTEARSRLEAAQAELFGTTPLDGSGSEPWRNMWEAARIYSEERAYPGHVFPVVKGDARCPLCQQVLSADAGSRLQHFEKSLLSTAQTESARATDEYLRRFDELENLTFGDSTIDADIADLSVELPSVAAAVTSLLRTASDRRDGALAALVAGKLNLDDLRLCPTIPHELVEQISALKTRAEVLSSSSSDPTLLEAIERELQDLEARQVLSTSLPEVLKVIETKRRLAAYQLALRDTTTTGITHKSTEMTSRLVTKRLASSFTTELQRLAFTHVEVEVQAIGGSRGALYHKLAFRRAANVDLPQVVSEGEARCLALAAFFAELSTEADKSAILFDDPVSSLDHNWRESVARRLVEEARTRQVIVFTHDIVFLLSLQRVAAELGIDCSHQQVRREVLGAGVSSQELPWVAMGVRQRIGVLRKEWQAAEKARRKGSRETYESQAVLLYGHLREAWERGLEEILLNRVVERYRPSVESLRASCLADIQTEDCEALAIGMAKSSRWLAGHDKAPAENVPVPEPAEIKDDIDALDNWVQRISARRK